MGVTVTCGLVSGYKELKEVTKLKNSARQALRRAKREGQGNLETVKSLAANFLSLVRTHSQLKKASARRLHCNEVKASREECHNNFWSYAKGLLDSQSTCKIAPTFTASSAQSYFSDVYKSSAHQFEIPSWMPIPPPPHSHTGMVMDSITQEELVKAIRKSNPSSAPSPFDRISYLIVKKCPSLQPAILNLFNSVLAEGNIPSSWKAAAVKLIPKDSAKKDPSSPGNFRPIALLASFCLLF